MSERIAFHILRMQENDIQNFVGTVQDAWDKVKPCETCGYWDDVSPCRICGDSARDHAVVCVVETSQDLVAVSRVRNFNGVYHVLGGALSPLDGVGPQDLKINSLLQRISEGGIREIILALNPDMEGESTSDYISKKIRSWAAGQNGAQMFEIKVTRLAQGLPAGSELEYADEMTLLRAFEGRREMSSMPPAETKPQE
jgi:recombination protein RecR